jgi:hypothetical protein
MNEKSGPKAAPQTPDANRESGDRVPQGCDTDRVLTAEALARAASRAWLAHLAGSLDLLADDGVAFDRLLVRLEDELGYLVAVAA